VNTIVLPCDLHWDVTGITKVIRHHCPASSFTTKQASVYRLTRAAAASMKI
jgi:hypothetical protein